MPTKSIYAPQRPAAAPTVQSRIIAVGDAHNGILDVTEDRVGNVGNAANLRVPVAQVAYGTIAGQTLWANPAAIPANATVTAIMQARARTARNPHDLAICIAPPTVQEGIQNTALPDFDLKAVVHSGVGASNTRAIVDIMNGFQMSLPATNVIVEAVYSLISVVATAIPINISTALGYGNRAAAARPTFTGRFFQVAVGGRTEFFVPPFAQDVTIYNFDTAGNSVPLKIAFETNAADLAVVTLSANANEKLSVPNGTISIFVQNLATNPAAVSGIVKWGLAL